MSSNGKGDIARPFSIDDNTFAKRWEVAFGQTDKQEAEAPPQRPGASEAKNKKAKSQRKALN